MEMSQVVRRALRLAVLVILFVPLTYLIVLSLLGRGDEQTGAYGAAWSPAVLPLFGRTVALALGASAIALILGGLAAAVFESRRFPLPWTECAPGRPAGNPSLSARPSRRASFSAAWDFTANCALQGG